ncbi:MAG: hemin receptor [Burkholderiales bacterium RIFCSPLOWO2_02_FULL_57_36]|nr:MAG: hemin receptor [Burkholderiales bacterium RIFCSPLOWO2_02_FULL_57_36]
MTPQQITLVQTSWQKVVPIKEKAAELFYRKLFETDPSLQPMFKGDIVEQGRKLMAMLNTVVMKLDQLGDIVPAVQDLGTRHVAYRVKDKDYDTVAGALLWTLGAGLGDAFTEEVKEAWTRAYTILANAMKDAAKTVPA